MREKPLDLPSGFFVWGDKMAGMAYKGARTNSSVASDHVWTKYRNPVVCNDDGCTGGGYDYGKTNATINGIVANGSTNVFVNGRAVAGSGDSVTETESYSLGGWELDYSDGGGTGYVTSGSSNVFVNGKQAATAGSSVDTHAGTTTSIAEGSSNVHIN